ncbi:uncharacterized protein LOC114533760 [Dendronephthya gigantea]|uniref:uncharacterized protein LOC114533760 n=1 Tax=Dendronephthya gigantea TaxID=151771 RepID=UPI0010691F40|nr:uncharacterized protein LOC114533760 [Dendronephthya gigantea]
MIYSIFLCLFVLVAITIPVESNCGCRIPFKAIGCRKDKRHDRALPKMLINERDRSSNYYNGFNIDWYNWDDYLPAFTCRCAEAAMKKGYKYFGLQFWGECWSGPSPAADTEYDKHGVGKECFGFGYEKCTNNDKNCVGKNNHNFIYEIEPFKCPVKFERLGCYRDRGDVPPLRHYILTDRQRGLKVSSGRDIDWYHYDTYLPEFACRCAMKTVERGWNTFGLQYYGECWSGENGDVAYYKEGSTSTCVNKCFKPCQNYDALCIGKAFTNFVYRVTTDVCEIPYKAVGCYSEPAAERALTELILDDVDPTSSTFMGIVSADFKDWNEYVKGLICRCARKIKEKGYRTFGINNKGKCYSSAYADSHYDMHGVSNQCYNDTTTPCLTPNCVGGENTNYVYQLQESNIV